MVAGAAEQAMLAAAEVANTQAAERRSHGADPFGVQQGSHRYAPGTGDLKANAQSLHHGGRAGRTEFGNFPKPQAVPFATSLTTSGQMPWLQQLQSQPSLGVQQEATQHDMAHFYHSQQQCTPHLTPQPAKHQQFAAANPQLYMQAEPLKPGLYQISSVVQRMPQMDNSTLHSLNHSHLQGNESGLDGRTGLSAGGLKKRNRRLVQHGEVPSGDGLGALSTSFPSKFGQDEGAEMIVAPGYQYQDSSLPASKTSNTRHSQPGVDKRQQRRQRKNITDFMDEQGTPPSQAPHTASNRAHAPFNEVLAGPRQSAHPATVAQSTVLGPRMADPMS